MDNNNQSIIFPAYAKISFTLITIALIVVFMYFGQQILLPLLLSLLLAILLRPVVVFLNIKIRIPHVIAVLLAVVLFVLIVSSVVFFVSWKVSDITDDWQQIKTNFFLHYKHLQQWIKLNYNMSYNQQQGYVEQIKNETFSSDRNLMGNTLNSFTSTLVNVVLIPIYTFLILLYRKLFVEFLYKVVSEKNKTTLVEVLNQVNVVVHSYIVGLFIELIVVATLTTTGFLILGVKYALLLGVITAVLNLIPYIGILAAGLISIFATLGNSTDVSIIAGIIIVNSLVQLIDNNIIVPKIVGNKVRINALVTMVGVIIAGSIWGVSGMVLSIPITAILKVIFDHSEPLKPFGFLLGNPEPIAKSTLLTKVLNIKLKSK